MQKILEEEKIWFRFSFMLLYNANICIIEFYIHSLLLTNPVCTVFLCY